MELLENDNIDIGDKQSYDRLIDGKDIRFKTEITDDQRGIISSIEAGIKHFKRKNIHLHVRENFLLSFIDMGANIDRKSRKEVVDSLKAKSETIDRQNLLNEQAKIIR